MWFKSEPRGRKTAWVQPGKASNTMSDYWLTIRSRLLSRRRVLASSAGFAGATAFVMACGGGDKGAKQPIDPSGLLTKPEDSTKEAVKGGTMVLTANAD